MDLDELPAIMDTAAATLSKLSNIFDRAKPQFPHGPSSGSSPEYDNLLRTWADLLPGLPPIDGFAITTELPDVDSIGRSWIDYIDIGEPPYALYEELEAPRKNDVEEWIAMFKETFGR